MSQEKAKIDLQGMEEYLEARANRKYFIPIEKRISAYEWYVIEELAAKYGATMVGDCIAPNLINGIAWKYIVNMECWECGEWVDISLTKTSLKNHLRAVGKSESEEVICDSCKTKRKAQEKQARKETVAQHKQNRADNTKEYCEIYCNPEYSWDKGTKQRDRWNEIINQYVNWETVSKCLKSLKYKDFLKTPYWAAVAARKRYQAKFRCQLCNGNDELHVHHRSYDHHGEEHQHLEDLIVLCRSCHKNFHDIEQDSSS